MASILPSERLRVFISSAQSAEGLFAWSDVRRKTKDKLKECIYLNPFIIEDVASITPSNQFYQQELLKSDIVVLLVKGEVRKGTATEFALATKHHKPMLVYFLEDGTTKDLSVVELKSDIQSTDCCTYRAMKSFEGIENEIFNDVIENVIRYFQSIPYRADTQMVSTTTSISREDIASSKYSVPTKMALNLFDSCYSYVFELLNLNRIKPEEKTEKSNFHDFGIATLDWLVLGKELNCDERILELIKELSDLYDNTDWLIKRWDAIRFELHGDFEKALAAEKLALNLAKENNVPKWIVNDILIDCRNIEAEVYGQKREYLLEGEAQKELNSLETIVYLPVLDRYLGEIHNALTKEEIKIKTASYNTVFFGTSLGSVINNVVNYFFSSLLYGSYTHMLISRKLLSEVLYKYNELTNEQPLLIEAIKLLAIRGDAKTFEKIIHTNWDEAYVEIVSSADNIWYLAEKAPFSCRDEIKQTVLKVLGLYLSDAVFETAEKYLFEYSNSVYWANSESYFECISHNIVRLNSSRIIEMLTGIIKEQRFHIGTKLADIILRLNLENVDVKLQEDFRDALSEQLSFIVQNNGTPQIIAALESQNPSIFSRLAHLPNNGLKGTEKIFYDINMGNGDWTTVLKDEISTARTQFETNKNPGVYTGFAEQPYAMIKKIARNYYSSSTMQDPIVNEFFPLCIDVLSSQTVANIKNDCIDCLCDILIFAIKDKSLVPKELIEIIAKINPYESTNIIWESNSSFICRVLMIKIITGSSKKDELLEWCFGFAKKETKEKIVLAECIEQYLRNVEDLSEFDDITVASIVLQCFEDEYWYVRRIACKSLALLLDTKFKSLIERKLYEATSDTSHYVRNQVLLLCKDGEISDDDIKNKIVDILKNDANYAIRKFATE